MAKPKRKQKRYEPGTLAFFAVLGILLIALGTASLLSVLGVLQGSVFGQVKRITQGLGGSLCLGVGALLIVSGVLVAFSSGKGMPMRGVALVTVLYLSVLAIINLLSGVGQNTFMQQCVVYNNTQYTPPLVNASGFLNMVAAGYHMSAVSGMFGGGLGMLLAWPAQTFLGTAFSVAVLVILCVLCVLLFTGFDFGQLFSAARQGRAQRAAQRAAEEEENRRQQMLLEQQRQAAADAADLNNPSYLRRGRGGATGQPAVPNPAMAAYGAPMVAPGMPNPYLMMNGGACPPPVMPGQAPLMPQQPDLYNEIIVPQDKPPLWRRGD